MAEFIFKKFDYTNFNPIKDRRGVHKKGDFVNHKPDGWASNWPNIGDYANHFVCVRCPEITYAEASAANYRRAWQDNFSYEVLLSNPAQGRYTVRIWEQNAGAVNQNGLTSAKINLFLTGWGCENISYTTNSCQFDFVLWNAVRSPQFWDIPLIGSMVNFVLVSYLASTGIGRIEVTIVDPKVINQRAIDKITERGGTIVSNNHPVIVFDIERSIIFQRFRDDVKRKAQERYKRHQYSISATDVDEIVAAGGIVTISREVFLRKLINHLTI